MRRQNNTPPRATPPPRVITPSEKETGFSSFALDLGKQDLPVVKPYSGITANGWLNYGRVSESDNTYPQFVQSLFDCSLHYSIIKLKVSMTRGNGLIVERDEACEIVPDDLPEGHPTIAALDMYVNARDLFCKKISGGKRPYGWNELLKRTALDLVTFGGFAWQVCWSQDGTRVTGISHVPFHFIRVGRPDAEGCINGYYVCPDWESQQNGAGNLELTPSLMPPFDPSNVSPESPQIYYFAEYTSLVQFYPVPDYYGAITDIQTDRSISNYNQKNIDNGVMPSCIVTLPDPGNDASREKVAKEFNAQFAGSDNAGRRIITFSGYSDKGSEATATIVPFSTNNNADIFNQVSERVKQSIISAHQLSSPTLAGISGGGGLGGNGAEISVAYEYFYNSVIKQYQNTILENLQEMLLWAGYNCTLGIKNITPLQFRFTESILQAILTTDELRMATGYEPLPTDELAEPKVPQKMEVVLQPAKPVAAPVSPVTPTVAV